MSGRHQFTDYERSSIAKRLRFLAKDFTQEELATRGKVSLSQFKNYLSGTSDLPFPTALRLCRGTTHSAMWLMTGVEFGKNLFPRVKLLIENAGGLTAAAERIGIHPDKLFAALSHEHLERPILELAAAMQVSIDWLVGHLAEDVDEPEDET